MLPGAPCTQRAPPILRPWGWGGGGGGGHHTALEMCKDLNQDVAGFVWNQVKMPSCVMSNCVTELLNVGAYSASPYSPS